MAKKSKSANNYEFKVFSTEFMLSILTILTLASVLLDLILLSRFS